MSSQEPEQTFDDPSLKAAVKRVYGGQRAPDSLRRRLEQIAASEGDGQAEPLLRMASADAGKWGRRQLLYLRRSPLLGLAVAAVFLVVLGISYRITSWPTGSVAALDQSLLVALVQTHEQCCAAAPDHHNLAAPREDIHQVGLTLSRELGHRVLAADLVPDGWSFRGAGVCPAGDGHRCAHLLFNRGGQTLSVLSVPVKPGLSTGKVVRTVDGHPLVAHAKDGVLYCMVGYCRRGNLKTAELETLLARHQSELVLAEPPLALVVPIGLDR